MEKEIKSKLIEVKVKAISDGSENTLKTVATIFLVCGIIAAVAVIFASENKVMGIIYAIATFVGSLATWATLDVIANISLRLKGIQESMPLRLIDPTPSQTKEVKPADVKPEESEEKTSVKPGDYVFSRMTKNRYQVEDVKGDKIFINKGMLGGHKWESFSDFIIAQD
jgi:hypothetical protein